MIRGWINWCLCSGGAGRVWITQVIRSHGKLSYLQAKPCTYDKQSDKNPNKYNYSIEMLVKTSISPCDRKKLE